ncbi:hypothetical protein C6341_g13268 [Phytophthora cactorum]|nr:hypothetical protein C6341_g13268 [Phytophthora cactorum]
MLICLDHKVISLYKCGEHVTRAMPPHSRSLTAQKEFAKQMTRAGMKPAQIRTAMLLHFGMRPSKLPSLQKVQNVECYYRRTKLGGSDTTATEPRMSVDFLLLESCTDVLHVLYTPPKRTYNSATNSMQEALQVPTQVRANTARMEAEKQPMTGWPVDMANQSYPCSYLFKYGNCVHRQFAMQERTRIDGNGDEVLVNRGVPKRKRTTEGPAPTCRPRQAALHLLDTHYSGNKRALQLDAR